MIDISDRIFLILLLKRITISIAQNTIIKK